MVRISTLRQDDRGGVAIIAAVCGGLLCGVAALAVDLASLALDARRIQGSADLGALSAARDLANAEAAARATVGDNLKPGAEIWVRTGVYRPDRSLSPAARFAATAVDPNAAQVTVTSSSPLYFGRYLLGRDSVSITRRGTAAVQAAPPRAAFSIGSRLARLDGGIANALLSALTGSSVSLSLMDYRALATTQVNLLGFSDQLATTLDLEAGDYEGVLDQNISIAQALTALSGLDGDTVDGALDTLAAASSDVTVRLGDVIGVETSTDGNAALAQGLDVEVAALDLIMAMMEIGGGDRQLSLDLAAKPGLVDTRLSLAIGERPNQSPWLSLTDRGEPVVRTAQTRLLLRVRTEQSLAGLGQIELPVLIEIASAEATLDHLSCGPDRVVVGVRPGVARARLGTIRSGNLSDFKSPLTTGPTSLVDVAGKVQIKGSADIEVADMQFQGVSFDRGDIEARTLKTVQTRTMTESLMSSLISRTALEVKVLGLGLGLGNGPLTRAVEALLSPLGPTLDAVLNPVLDTLGVKLGEADVRVHGLSCPVLGGAPVLVG